MGTCDMQHLTDAIILWLWDNIADVPHPRKAVWICHAAGLGTPQEIAGWPIGSRDAALVQLRMMTFGPRVECVDMCPSCAQTAEMNIHLSAILSDAPHEIATSVAIPFGAFGREIRVPTTIDIEYVLSESLPGTYRQKMLRRCLGSGDMAIDKSEYDALELLLEQNDPLADIRFELECPSCKHRWNSLFDIVSLLWNEISSYARKLLYDIHTIALAYHWPEKEIVSLSRARRAFYLECIEG
jgi:hypothetical protein